MTMDKTSVEGVSRKDMESQKASLGMRGSPVKTASKMTKKTSKAIERKKKQVAELQKLIEKHKTVGILNLENSPARLVKTVRVKLKGKIEFVFAKKNIITRALEGSKREGVQQLLQNMSRIPALIFSDLDAFALFRELKASRQMVPAKPGQLAPSDITISAGPTPFAPGPAISELASLGLKTKVEGGKIHVRDEAVVVKAGQPVPGLAASILSKLGVTPMEIGVNLAFALEDKDLYAKAVLDIDSGKYAQDLKTAAWNAFVLAVELGIVTKETAGYMVAKAAREAKALDEKIPKTQ